MGKLCISEILEVGDNLLQCTNYLKLKVLHCSHSGLSKDLVEIKVRLLFLTVC